MKYVFTAGALLLCLILAQCGMERELNRDIDDVISYAPSVVSPKDVEALKATYRRGYELYKITCSGCHSASATGKDTIPDFNLTQLDDYKSSAVKGNADNHAVAATLSPEQLNDVLGFLLYRTLSKKARADRLKEDESRPN